MPRPVKYRRVESEPAVTCFKPVGVPQCELEEVVLTVEELEAIRLKDLENLEQEGCAERMQVSRPTFFRILASAREKIADALLTGKMLRVEGGTYRLATAQLRCKACAHEFEVPAGMVTQSAAIPCPSCQTPNVYTQGYAGNGQGHRRKRCRRGWRN